MNSSTEGNADKAKLEADSSSFAPSGADDKVSETVSEPSKDVAIGAPLADTTAEGVATAENKAAGPGPNGPDQTEYPPTLAVLPVMASLFLSMFLVALDRLIIATAIPRITDEFDSIDDIGWYGTAYMLTASALMLPLGRVYKFHSTKWVFLLAIGLFEIGSAVCGAAPSSLAFILGRAIAGAGSAGIFSGVVIIMTQIVPLHKRPMFTGAFGAVFGVSSVVGPLLGGVFTDEVSWRWCFYINLPIGCTAMVVLILLLKVKPPMESNLTFKQQIDRLDPIGTALFVPSMVSLILALQWGGFTYSWSSPRIIGLLTTFSVLFTGFVAVQFWKQDNGTVPPRIIRKRSIAAAVWFVFCSGSAMMVLVYYVPIWFQAVKGVTAIKSGIMLLPLILALVISSISSGIFTQKVGYYVPTMLLSPILSATGAGLLTTFKPSTPHAQWIGYQFLYGFGLGMSMQQPSLAAQAVLPQKDVSIGISLIFFTQQLGGAIFVSVAQNLFVGKLARGLSGIHGLNAHSIAQAGATNLRNLVPPELLPEVLRVYSKSLTQTWFVAVGLSAATFLGAISMEWVNIKKNKPKGPGQKPGGAKANNSETVEKIKEEV